MNQKSNLNDVFRTVAAKYLSSVDADPDSSNQHEFGGLSELKKTWGEVETGLNLDCQFIFLGMDDSHFLSTEGSITWYDARKNQSSRSSEWRIYYSSNSVTRAMKCGDLLVVSEYATGKAIVVVARSGSTYESQLLKLFRISKIKDRGFTVIDTSSDDVVLDISSRYILDSIGIQYEYSDESYLDQILMKFGTELPSTKVFSEFSRTTMPTPDPNSDADELLVAWMNREELLFRTFEKYMVLAKVKTGFDTVEEFVRYSLSVLNRRKSRVGYAFENHLEEIFKLRNIRYSRGAMTENRVKPDFIFPSIVEYKNLGFDEKLLTMLGVKSTCKDRWRQVLTEAKRIQNKHLITLEPSISDSQVNEMKNAFLQLVVPTNIIHTYSLDSQKWLINLETFLEIAELKQDQA